MRHNFTYTAATPSSRNDFIDAVSSQAEAIVINYELLNLLTEEINSQISSKKMGKFFKKLAVPMALLSFTPLGWVLSGITFLCGVYSSASDDLKKYIIYSGYDVAGRDILVLHHKQKVDLSYDKIVYPSYVKDVNYKKANKMLD